MNEGRNVYIRCWLFRSHVSRIDIKVRETRRPGWSKKEIYKP